MNANGSFYRKITYLVLIAVLLFPISQLGAPATNEKEGGRGGWLAQMRADENLGQADLGDIDPASETIRLATLGLRGVAVSMLWTKANEYKKKEDWTNFRATLDQLSKLQPYFIKFWEFQAWNLSYNVSVELDDVRDRFHYVKRGIEFLEKGTKYNRDSPYLLSTLGWFIGNKIGRADEHKDYRRLFKADDQFHINSDRTPEQRDNWLVSREKYEEAISAVDDRKKSLGQKNPTIFYSNPGKSQRNYGEAIEVEGTFGAKAKSAWATAARLWTNFGRRDLKSSIGLNIRLTDGDRLTEETKKLIEQLESLSKNPRKKALAAKRAALSTEELAVLDGPQTGLTEEARSLLYQAQGKINVTPADIADQILKNTPQKVAEARRLAKKISTNHERLRMIHSNSEVVNYDYWATRCNLEQTPAALNARDLAYAANRVFKVDADLLESKRMFEKSFAEWAKVIEAFPELELDTPTGSDIMDSVKQYSTVLEQLDLSMASDEIGRNFPLWDVVAENDNAGYYAEGLSKFRKADEPINDEGADQEPASEETDPN